METSRKMDEQKRKFIVIVTTDSKDDARIIKDDIIQELRCCFTFWENIGVWGVDPLELVGEFNGKNNDDKGERE